MEQNLRVRIQDVLILKKYSVNRLAGMNSSLQVRLNNQINKETSISATTVLLVLSTFPDVSAEWLLRGKGPILVSDPQNIQINNAHAHIGTANAGGTIQASPDQTAVIQAKDEMIAELKRDKENLMALLTTLTNK